MSTSDHSSSPGDAFSDDRYVLVSGDGHAGPPLPGFAPYFDPGERDEFDRYWRARPSAKLMEAAAAGDQDALAKFLDAVVKRVGFQHGCVSGREKRGSLLQTPLEHEASRG